MKRRLFHLFAMLALALSPLTLPAVASAKT